MFAIKSIVIFFGYLTVITLSNRLLQTLPSGSVSCASTTCLTGYGCIDGVGCVYGGSTCQGIASLQCPSPTIQSCIVDTTVCDPANGARDCGGICVEECSTASTCSNAPDAECTTATIGTTDYGICTPSTSSISCAENEVFSQCGTACPKKCGDSAFGACTQQCVIGCFCKPGYILDVENGDCIAEDACPLEETTSTEDPTVCAENEIYQTCGTACPKKCGDPAFGACTNQCVIGCFCKPGYVLDVEDGDCIPADECPTEEPTTTEDPTACGVNEVYSQCGSACPKKCGDPAFSACTNQCVIGCVCKPGHILDVEDGDCIPVDECPLEESTTTEDPTICGDNQVFNQCGSACPKKCGDPEFVACTRQCVPDCFCDSDAGYVLSEEGGECILEEECPTDEPVTTEECGENEVYKTCGTSCPTICGDSGFKICTLQCVVGCFCDTGYVLDEEDGTCISIDECPDTASSTEVTDISTTDDEDDEGECPGLDTAITLFYIFKFDKIQRVCDVCLSETSGNAANGRCDRFENILDGIVDDFSECVLSICDYGCAVGELVLSDTAGDDEYCGCDTFECGTLGSDANKYGLFMVFGVISVAFGWM